MPAKMVLEALLYSEDQDVWSAMGRALDFFAVSAKICRSPKETLNALLSQTFDIIFVDYKIREIASGILATVRGSKLNRQTMMMTLTGEDEALKAAYGYGVLLTMPRPKNAEHATRCLEPFYQLILKQRQKSIRFDTSISVQVRTKNGGRVQAKITNLSVTGAALLIAQGVAKGDIVSFDFQLPDRNTTIHATGRVAWSNDGRAGMGFALMLDPEQVALQQWISNRIHLSNSSHPIRSMRARVPASYQEARN